MSEMDAPTQSIEDLVEGLIRGAFATRGDRLKVLGALEEARQIIYASMWSKERLAYLGIDVLVVLAILFFYGWLLRAGIFELWRTFSFLSSGDAMAQVGGLRPEPVLVYTMLAMQYLIVLAATAGSIYAAFFRTPPLASAREILRLILAFVFGQIVSLLTVLGISH